MTTHGCSTDFITKCACPTHSTRTSLLKLQMQYMFIYRAVLDALSELLNGESHKAELQVLADAAQRAAEVWEEGGDWGEMMGKRACL